MRTIKEIEKELIGLGFVRSSNSISDRNALSYIVAGDHDLLFCWTNGWKLGYQFGTFCYKKGIAWYKIKDSLTLESIILLYKDM